MGKEIERRWLVSSYDRDIVRDRTGPIWKIRQGYLGDNTRIRLSSVDGYSHGEVTTKTGKGLTREELNETVSAAATIMLLDCTDQVVSKLRFFIREWQLDFFEAPLEGLILLEREFNSEADAAQAVLPDWIYEATEVTDTLTNRQLSRVAATAKSAKQDAEVARKISVADKIRNIYEARAGRQWLGNKYLPMPPIKSLQPADIIDLHKVPLAKIVLTGAPCTGKSTAIRALEKTLPNVKCVPEAATILMGQVGLSHTLPPEIFQKALHDVQWSFEDGAIAQAELMSDIKAVVMDRGTIDGAAFVGGLEVYERLLKTTVIEEYSRYTHVLMLGLPSEEVYNREKSNNPVRKESYEDAVRVEKRVREVWGGHPGFVFLGDAPSWPEKLNMIEDTITKIIEETECATQA